MRSVAPLLLVTALLAGAVRSGEGDHRSAQQILRDLADPGYQTRRKAVLAVEGRSEPELLDALLRMARSDPHPNIRGYCAEVLGTFRDERVFPVLAEMVGGESSPGPRQQALVALGRLGDPRGFDLLIERLASERIDRAYAAKGLGLLGDPRAFEPIAKLYLASTGDPYLEDAAPDALLALDEDRALDLLLAGFCESEPAPRFSLVEALRGHPGRKLREFMTALLESEEEALRLAAIRVLGKAGDSGTVPHLVPFLHDGRSERRPAADALREIGDEAAARPIAATLLREKDPVTRAVLLRSLAELGDRRAVSAIVPFLADDGTTPQPMEISSVWGYPYNLHVKAAALWALRTLLDGEPPVPLEELVRFPLPARSDWAERKIPALLDWWEAHRTDPAYRFED